ncbi:MAG: hypothetical protein ACI31C_07245, partial [Muribaculaceae bacterium]
GVSTSLTPGWAQPSLGSIAWEKTTLEGLQTESTEEPAKQVAHAKPHPPTKNNLRSAVAPHS